MAVKFEFYLDDDDYERLYAIKEDMGKEDLTGNEFAKELLENKLYSLYPKKVKYDDETGERIK